MIAYSLSMKGSFRDALRELDEVIPRYRRVVDADSANLGDMLGTLADVSLRAGRLNDARRAAEEDVAILTKRSTPDPHILGTALIELAATRVAQGAAADGLAHGERAASVLTRAYGTDHFDVAGALGVVGHARLALGQREEARAALERAVAIFDRRTPTPTEGSDARFRLAQLLGGGERARDLARRALADLTATGMDPHLRAEVERWLRSSRPAKQ
jgi:tetratricopeptide (TPR) repeat protein